MANGSLINEFSAYGSLSLIIGGATRHTYQLLDPISVSNSLASVGWPMDDYRDLNSFSNPIGGKPGKIRVAILSGDADDIWNKLAGIAATTSYNWWVALVIGMGVTRGGFFFGPSIPGADVMTNPEHDPEAVYDNLRICGQRRVGPGQVDGSDGITILELADYRYAKAGVKVSKGYNVHAELSEDEFYSATLIDGENKWDWSDILDDLWEKSGISTDAPKPGAFPSAEPEGISFYDTPVLEAYDDVLKLTGHRLVLDRTKILPTFTVGDLEYSGVASDLGSNWHRMVRPFHEQDGVIRLDERGRTESDMRLPKWIAVRFRAVYPQEDTGYDKSNPVFLKWFELENEIAGVDPRMAAAEGFIFYDTEMYVDCDTYATFDAGFLPSPFKGEWQAGVTYTTGDYVTDVPNGEREPKVYKATAGSTGSKPSDTPSSWSEQPAGEYLTPSNDAALDTRFGEMKTLITTKILLAWRNNKTSYQGLLNAIPGMVCEVEHRVRADGIHTLIRDWPWEFWSFGEPDLLSDGGSSGKPVAGQVVCYLGDGFYRIKPIDGPTWTNPVAWPNSPCVPGQACTWQWDEDGQSWSQLTACSGTCTCSEPGEAGAYDAEVRLTACTYPGAGCMGTVTIEWTEDGGGPGVDTWEIVAGSCGPDCAPDEPDRDGSAYGEQLEVDCKRTDRCEDAYPDPANLCDIPLADGDPDTAVSRQLGGGDPGATNNWFLAYQPSKLTMSPGTGVLCIPYWRGLDFDSNDIPERDRWGADLPEKLKQGHFYMIVEAEQPLMLVYMPTAIECCPNGSIKISQFTPLIMEGFACNPKFDPCPT